jgi:hypothetical protein
MAVPHAGRIILVIAILQLLVLAAAAQQSRIVGSVTDQSGAVVPDVSVTAKDIATGETRQATSSSVGEYAIPNLAAGSYLVSAEKQGFRRQVLEHVRLEVQAAQTVDFVLRPGAESEQVTVNSTPPALQTTDSSVSTFFETKVVDEIPLNGRNFLQLQLLSPGVTMGGPGVWQAIQISALNTGIGGGIFRSAGHPILITISSLMVSHSKKQWTGSMV